MTRITVYVTLALLMLEMGCQCQDTSILATIHKMSGTVDRDFADAQKKWQTAEMGGKFRLGDGIRTQHNATALLKLSEGSKLKLTQNSQIRFMTMRTKQGKSGQGIDVETGEAELLVGQADLSLLTSVGTATITSGSVVKLRRVDEGMAFEVEIGKATYYDKNNAATPVEAGESITVDIGAAILEKFSNAPVDTGAEQAPPADTEARPDTSSEDRLEETDEEKQEAVAPERPSGPDRGIKSQTTVMEIPDGPAKADFMASPGSNFVVHAPTPPVVVAFDTANRCPNGAAVQVGRSWISKGTSAVHVKFGAGRHRYRVKCLEKGGALGQDTARGRVHVLRDAGVAKLPGNPPTSFIETDGRRYKILYQTRQPKISVKWPKAPKGQKYKLHIDGKKHIATPKPNHTLASGTLSEGVHQLNFEAIGSLARTSRTTTVEIRFDNAAPKASITAPGDESFGPGVVRVKGTAMAKWAVKLLGGTIEKDAQHRFVGEANYTGNYMSVTLRLSHPRRGVHYYIRRARGQGLQL